MTENLLSKMYIEGALMNKSGNIALNQFYAYVNHPEGPILSDFLSTLLIIYRNYD